MTALLRTFTRMSPSSTVKGVIVNEPNEHVNIILQDEETGKRTLEFYKRNSETKERVHWAMPAKVIAGGLIKVLDMAKTL